MANEIKKDTIIDLEVKNSDCGDKEKSGVQVRPMSYAQAQNILNIEKKIGKERHSLPKDSKFKLDANGQIITK